MIGETRGKYLAHVIIGTIFPHLDGAPRWVNCQEWGNGDTRLHHLWWLKHLPHVAGSSGGISYNWWEYITDPNLVL